MADVQLKTIARKARVLRGIRFEIDHCAHRVNATADSD
jgi:hypothetical protein